MINLLPTGFHGDGNAYPAAARCHAGHLTPGVTVRVIAFHTVQKSVAIVASCRDSEENGQPLRGLSPPLTNHGSAVGREEMECGSVVELLP